MAGLVRQNVTNHYLKKTALLKLLKRLFPEHEDFDIRVCQAGSS